MIRPLRRRLGLSAKLALFFLALGLPALVVVETLVLELEYREAMRDVDAGALRQAAENIAVDIAAAVGDEGAVSELATRERLQLAVLRMLRPHQGFVRQVYVLAELSDQPLLADLYDRGGGLRASSADAPAPVPAAELSDALAGNVVVAGSDRDVLRWRRVLVPVRDAGGVVRGALALRLELRRPWTSLWLDPSFEWPVLFAVMAVFGMATAFFFALYVSRRLRRVERAVARWSLGDFRDRIVDPSSDELGRLAGSLNAMAAELHQHLVMRAQLATLTERQRLARDLHDTVKQKVFALKLQLAASTQLLARDTANAGARVTEAARIVEEIQHELATLILELRSDLPDAALGPELQRRAQEWSRRSGIAAEWRRCDDMPVSGAVREQVARLLDEALANVWRHSGARHVTLSLGCDDGEAGLEILDDGSGISGDAGGMGLGNMRARAATLPGGSLEIGNQPRAGAHVRLRWQQLNPENAT